MNNPLVINLAKRLVAMRDFLDQTNDEAKLQFLYERIYQRVPEPVETQLGLDFVNSTQLLDDPTNTVATASAPVKLDAQGKPVKRPGNNGPKKPAPLTAWQEYAQALLQANEASFVN
ncbi:MAG TPA: hypothetical protein VK815_16065, partial [Candidatus Acidoferrales bacterium]|nr:hypothetical protein [Candidatus Acidoferrales bacterium]